MNYQIDFYFYMEGLGKYRVNLKLKDQIFRMEQKIYSKQKDIFKVTVNLKIDFLKTIKQYVYTLEGNQNNQHVEVERNILAFIKQNQVIQIFDTSDYLNQQTQLFTPGSWFKDQIIEQNNDRDIILAFVQKESSTLMLEGLKEFINKGNFLNYMDLILKIDHKILSIIQICDKQENETFLWKLERIELLSNQSVRNNCLELYNILKIENQTPEIVTRIQQMYLKFQLRFIFKYKISNQSEIKNQNLETMITSWLKYKSQQDIWQEKENILYFSSIKQSEKVRPFIEQYWRIILARCICDKEQLEFLLRNHQIIKPYITSQNLFINNVVPEFNDYFIKNIGKFISAFDTNGDILRNSFSEQNFYNLLNKEQQIALLVELHQRNIKLTFSLMSFLKQIMKNINYVQELNNCLPVFKINPFMDIRVDLIAVFKKLLNKMNSYDVKILLKQQQTFVQFLKIQKINQETYIQSQNKEVIFEFLDQYENSLIQVEEKDTPKKNYEIPNDSQQHHLIEADIDSFELKIKTCIIEYLSKLNEDDIITLIHNEKKQQKDIPQIFSDVITLRTKILEGEGKLKESYRIILKMLMKLNQRIYEKEIHYYLSKFENVVIEIYNMNKEKNINLSTQSTLDHLTEFKQFKAFYKIVNEDVNNFQSQINEEKVLDVEKIVSNTIFQQIIDFFQKLQINFSKHLLDKIKTYTLEMNKRKTFMDRFGYIYEKELSVFKELFSDNTKISDIDKAISSQNHLKEYYEFYDTFKDTYIYMRILENLEGRNDGLAANNLAQNARKGVIEFIQLLFQSDLPVFNHLKCDIYNISKLKKEENLEFNTVSIFKDKIITFEIFYFLVGNYYDQMKFRINDLLKDTIIKTSIKDIDSVLLRASSFSFFIQFGGVIQNLFQQYHVQSNSQVNAQINKNVEDFLSKKDLINSSNILDNSIPINIMSDYKVKFGGNEDDSGIEIIEKLNEIVTYMITHQNKVSFLELIEFNDENDSTIISLIIKLNSYLSIFNDLAQYRIKCKESSDSLSISSFLEYIIIFSRNFLSDSKKRVDLEECIKEFYKIKSISFTFEKTKSFITLTQDIVSKGNFIYEIDPKNLSLVTLNVLCIKKKFSEKEVREICSRVILEQNTSTSILAQHQSLLKIQKRQNQDISELENLTEESLNVNLSPPEMKKEKEKQIIMQMFKDVMFKFKKQWFKAEELKEILENLIQFGNIDVLSERINYSNENEQYQESFEKIQSDCLFYSEKKKEWMIYLRSIIQKYPAFSIIGFIHYKPLFEYCSGKNSIISDNLNEILKFIGNSNEDISLLPKRVGEKPSLETIAKTCTQQFSFETHEVKEEQGEIKCIPYQGSKELIQVLMENIKSKKNIPPHYCYFFCEKHSQISDLELFILRYEFLTSQDKQSDYFIIFNTPLERKQMLTFSQILRKLQESSPKQSNNLYIMKQDDLMMDEIEAISEISVYEICKKFLARGQSDKFKQIQKKCEFYFSKNAGSGKTFTIQRKQQQQQQWIRIPINGNWIRGQFLEQVREIILKMYGNVNENNDLHIHLELYEMQDLDLNTLIFELVILQSISLHSNNYLGLSNNTCFYFEVSNSISEVLLKSLYIREYFQSVLVNFSLANFETNHSHLSEEEKLNYTACYKYLDCLDNCLSQGQKYYLDKNEISDIEINQSNFQELISQKLLTDQQQVFSSFYQINHFINLFGSEMRKFEKSVYLQIDHLTTLQLNQGIRTQIVEMSFELCKKVSITNIIQDNEEQGLKISQILHNRDQLIPKFSSYMGNFVTFQEQDNPCVTSFFENKKSTSHCFVSLYERQKSSLIYLNEIDKPEMFLKWLIMFINKDEQFVYDKENDIEFSNIKEKDEEKDKNNTLRKLAMRIVIQKDNFFKISMMFMRARSYSPLIIMGQAGIGKTVLVELMASIMDATFDKLTIHAGIQEKQIIEFVSKIIEKNKLEQNGQRLLKKIVLFFDEVNTSKLVGGLFKEIIVDRCMKGLQLPQNVIPIAAINPYRMKSEKQKEMLSIQIHGGIKRELVSRIENIDLEYNVEPLPESMYSFVWNFDNLSQEDEERYICFMVKQKNKNFMEKQKDKKCIENHEFKEEELSLISKAILKCQMHLRQEMGYSSACSLRDVNRFLRLLFWFVKFIGICKQNSFVSVNSNIYQILAFYVIYCVRLPLPQQRKAFANMCSNSLNIQLNIFNQLINDVLGFIISKMEVPKGIVKNTALKQNIFILIVSILKKIPVVLIGPPGSSKTISMRIIIETMKGKQSSSPFFQQFPALLPVFYQGHIQSTSERILEVFENAKQNKKSFDAEGQAKNYVSLVYIEEIGLAEISPHNPLKVLHETLEKPTVSVACISNWPLDQSKMNRMLSVYRLDIIKKELFETIKCIEKGCADNQNQKHKNFLKDDIIKSICKVYKNYLNQFKKKFPHYEQFHGLRDFYGMAKILYLKLLQHKQNILTDKHSNVQEKIIQQTIFDSFLRHFSGLDESREIMISCLEDAFPSIKNLPNKIENVDVNMIKQNLIEDYPNFTSRNLMLISQNVHSAINFISNELFVLKKPFDTFIGSDFYEDLQTESSIEVINQIISCIEAGRIVIITNLDNIYQSLYDLLNQNYRQVQDRTFCKISFGSDNNNVEVHPKFKIILIIQQTQIHRMDGPLINRFEKHSFEEIMIMKDSDLIRAKYVIDYFSKPGLEHLFLFDNLKEVVRSLIFQQRMLHGKDDLDNDKIIQTLYHLTSLSETLQYCDPEDNLKKKKVISSLYHFSFQDFLQNKILNSPKLSYEQQLFTIFSPSIFFNQESDQIYKTINLSMLNSSRLLEEQMTDFFAGRIHDDLKECLISDLSQSVIRSKPHIMVIISDQNEKLEKINYVRNKVAEQFVTNSSPSNCFVIMVIRTHEKFSMLPFFCQWEQYYIEDLFPLRAQIKTEIIKFFDLKKWFSKLDSPFLQTIEFKEIISEFLKKSENVTSSFKLLKYKEVSEGYLLARLKQLQKIFCFEENTHLSFKKIAIQIIFARTKVYLDSLGINSIHDFLVKYIIKRGSIKQISSLHSAVWRGLNEIMQQSFALLIRQMEHSSLVYSLSMNVIEIDQFAIKNLCRFTEKEFDEQNQENLINLIIQSFNKDENSLIIDNQSKDILFPDSLIIFRQINDIVQKIQISTNDNELKKSIEAINQQMTEKMTKSYIESLCQFDQYILRDFETFEIKGTEAFQQKIEKQIIQYIDLGQIPQIIVIIFSLKWFKNDIYKFIRLFNTFYWLEDADTLLQVNKNKQIEGNCLIKYGKNIAFKLYEMMKPTLQLINKMKDNYVNYGYMVDVLIQFVDTFDIDQDNNMQQIKNNLMCYSALEITNNNTESLSVKEENFIKQLCCGEITVKQFTTLTKTIRDLYPQELNTELNSIQQRIFSIGLDIYNSQLKSKRNDSFYALICHALPFLIWIEQECMKFKIPLNSQLIVKYITILKSIVTKISLKDIQDIFSSENIKKYQFANELTSQTEPTPLVILADLLQQNFLHNIFISEPNLKIIEDILDIICTNDINKLKVFQQTIYLSIFCEAITYALDASSLEFPNLEQLFKQFLSEPLKIYIVKRVLSEFKEEQRAKQFCNTSPYFKEVEWIMKYIDDKSFFLNSQFLDQSQKKLFNSLFSSKQSLKDKLIQYIQLDMPVAAVLNVFQELQKGIIQEKELYPFMLINNLFLFNRNKEQNKQLYQCLNCSEFIYSNKCEHLQSKHPCMRCGKLIAAGNVNTKQVVKDVQNNLEKLQQEEKNNVWSGIYLRLEEDQIDFKLNEGTSLDLRIFTLVYAQCLLLASQEQSFQYKQSQNIEIFNRTTNQIEERPMIKMNQILKINYEADYIEYLQEQIDFSISHIIQIMESVYHESKQRIEIIIFKIIYNLIRNPQAQRSLSSQERDKINIELSQSIQQILTLSFQVPPPSLVMKQFQKTLRSVNSNITADFVQTYLGQVIPKNKYKVLQELLNLSKLQEMNYSLKILIQFYTLVNDNLSQKFTKKKSLDINLLEALKCYPNDSLLDFYANEVIPVWEKIKKTYEKYENGCDEIAIESLSQKTKLSNLIFSDKDFGYFPKVLDLLCDTHNNFINRIHQLLSMERNFSQFKFILVEKPLSSIDLDLNIVRPYDKNILTQFFFNDIQTSVNPSYIYDLNLLEKELIKTVFSGTSLISQVNVKKFSFQADINHIGLLSYFMIPQTIISQDILDRLLQILKEKEEALDFLSIMSQIFSYYKAEKNHKDISLKDALISLQIFTPPKLSDLLEGKLKLSHVNQIIINLEEYLMDSLVNDCNPYYHLPLDEQIAKSAIEFVSKYMTINNFRLALGRFIIRALSQDKNYISEKQKLFELSVYEEFWNDSSMIKDIYILACNDKCLIAHSLSLYTQVNDSIKHPINNQIRQDKSIKEKNHSMYMDSLTDSNFTTPLINLTH